MYATTSTNTRLLFRLSDLEIARCTNVNFAGDAYDTKSTNNYVFLFGETIISWLRKKQNCIVKSTMEVEYISCNTTISNDV
jgi:hypothetical protein